MLDSVRLGWKELVKNWKEMDRNGQSWTEVDNVGQGWFRIGQKYIENDGQSWGELDRVRHSSKELDI